MRLYSLCLDFDIFEPRLESCIFKCIFWVKGSYFGVYDSGFLERRSQGLSKWHQCRLSINSPVANFISVLIAIAMVHTAYDRRTKQFLMLAADQYVQAALFRTPRANFPHRVHFTSFACCIYKRTYALQQCFGKLKPGGGPHIMPRDHLFLPSSHIPPFRLQQSPHHKRGSFWLITRLIFQSY